MMYNTKRETFPNVIFDYVIGFSEGTSFDITNAAESITQLKKATPRLPNLP